jgi:hypothetical protein
MRVPQLVLAAMLAGSALHCSSEEPAPHDENLVVSHPSALVITSPARAAFIEDDGSPVEIRGTGATSALTINGERAEVAADGSFRAKVSPAKGLNLVVALDGDSRLETPFLFGHFVSAETPVKQAVALDVGSRGISGLAPAASLESVTNLALAKRDLIGSLKGQSFAGTVTGATWTFAVTGGGNGAATVGFAAVAKGLGVDAAVKDVIVDGRLSIKALGLTYARDVRITVDRAVVTGDVELAVDDAKGALTAAMPTAEAKLDGFRFDTDNAGFPCCVDSIITGVMKPKVEAAIRDGIRQEVPKAVQLTLDGIGIPKQLDFAAAGVALHIPTATRFDGASFDLNGGTITASTLFGGKPAPGTPGARAPGWLALGRAYAEPPARAPVLGVSFSIDAVNQLMFAAWGSGALAFTFPEPLSAKLTPSLPPIVSVADSGALRVGLGEIVVQRTSSATPLAAVTILQDVVPSGDHDALVLTPKGEPTISVTYLTDDSVGSGGSNLIAAAAKDQLGKFLKPFRIPVPKFALDRLGAGFAGQSLAIESPSVVVDKKTGRVGASGTMTLVH